MNKPWSIVQDDKSLGNFTVLYDESPKNGFDSITSLELKFKCRPKLGPDEASRIAFRRVTDDYRCWVWNLIADNRVIIKGGALVVEEHEPTLEHLVKLAGYSEYI